jgi:hypothetical protein
VAIGENVHAKWKW